MRKQLLFIALLSLSNLKADWKSALLCGSFMPESNLAKAGIYGAATLIPSFLL